MRICATVAILVSALSTARADDGVYFTEAVGVGIAKGDLESTVGRSIQTRIAVGARWKWLALEPWMRADMHPDRVGAIRGILGGEPVDGKADLAAYGGDLKLVGPIYQGPNGERLEGYVRGGLSYASATGMMEGYTGRSVGAAAGVQLTGQVRALGFLWAPLFFLKRGPKITGSLYMDQGYDWYSLRQGSSTITGRIGHVSIGFSLGSGF